jgi:hypothetical protein
MPLKDWRISFFAYDPKEAVIGGKMISALRSR